MGRTEKRRPSSKTILDQDPDPKVLTIANPDRSSSKISDLAGYGALEACSEKVCFCKTYDTVFNFYAVSLRMLEPGGSLGILYRSFVGGMRVAFFSQVWGWDVSVRIWG